MNQNKTKSLEFGTGGIRGIMGPSADQMNPQTVTRIVTGFCHYIDAQFSSKEKKRGIVIAYDSRHNSYEFAKLTAEILVTHDISVFMFHTVETTPMLSFTIRHLGCIGGICITASHNPPQYNGIKVYLADGGQIVPPQDTIIIESIRKVPFDLPVPKSIFDDAIKNSKIQYVDQSVYDAYFNHILKIIALGTQKIDTIPVTNKDSSLSVVYTPLHGTGLKPVQRLLKNLNIQNVFIVPEQAEPDGSFPTIHKPNPEEYATLNLAVKYASERDADVIFATDPDSDRLAICVKDPMRAHGVYKNQSIQDYVCLNGNQISALLLNSLLSAMQQKGLLTTNHIVVKTIVTSGLLEHICRGYNVQIFNTPTGFKWIAGLLKQWETKHPEYKFIFGAEESLGYMLDNGVRDKDGVAALGYAVQIISQLKSQHMNACDALFELFKKFGAWQEDLISFDFEPSNAGNEKITKIMQYFRSTPPKKYHEILITQTIDYLHLEYVDTDTPLWSKMDVLQFILEDGSQISIRPSGTEPKLKIYISVCTRYHNIEEALQQTHDKMKALRYELLTQVQQIIS